ncbi:EAL domain-containing protein [Coleofasciculus sp. FACHB-1120]|nr:EAL domain-containing protein [Coleofasciculus sp. FACHB-1120]
MSQIHPLNLVIQPDDKETSCCLSSIGFQELPAMPQLLYQTVNNHELVNIFLKISQVLSETSQASSRFFLTRTEQRESSIEISPRDYQNLLGDFLKAQPISTITQAVKYAWFFQILAKQQIFFHYQPIFNLSSGEIIAYECLARAKDDREGNFSGYQLIEAALSTKLAYEFDELARTICLQSIAATKSHQTFFINILPNVISKDPASLEQNIQLILDLGLQPEQIVFELTEVEALVSCPKLLKTINRLREMGFGIAVDDLCACVSPDNYFMEFCPDLIKIDRRLVHGCSQHSLKQVMLKSLVNSAHNLGIRVVAEGLEEMEDIEFCCEIGVDYGQGFGLAMPQVTLQQQRLDFRKSSLRILSYTDPCTC